jgi:hypothetical protein
MGIIQHGDHPNPDGLEGIFLARERRIPRKEGRLFDPKHQKILRHDSQARSQSRAYGRIPGAQRAPLPRLGELKKAAIDPENLRLI